MMIVKKHLRIATWNVRCATRPRKWSAAFVDAIVALGADVVVLTEYASRPAGCLLEVGLRDAGFHASCASSRVERENQILIVARVPLQRGHLEAPPIGPSVPSNFLHVVLPDVGMALLGLRIPDYSRDRRRRHSTWDWLELAAASLVGQPAVLAGDFNTDVRYSVANCGDRLRRLVDQGWQTAGAAGPSFWNPSGSAVCIDHLFASPSLAVGSAAYVQESGGHALVGRRPGRTFTDGQPIAENALSDHAALVVDVSLNAPP